MTSPGIMIENGPEAEAKRVPGDKEMRIIDTDQARKLFGTQAERLDGVTVCVFHSLSPEDILNRKHSSLSMTTNNCKYFSLVILRNRLGCLVLTTLQHHPLLSLVRRTPFRSMANLFLFGPFDASQWRYLPPSTSTTHVYSSRRQQLA